MTKSQLPLLFAAVVLLVIVNLNHLNSTTNSIFLIVEPPSDHPNKANRLVTTSSYNQTNNNNNKYDTSIRNGRISKKKPRNEEMTTISTANQIEDENNNHQGLLLSVPFYIYNDLLMLPEHNNNSSSNNNNNNNNNSATYGGLPIEDAINQLISIKHTNDVRFIRAAMNHPMRTMDPTQAKLFVLPLFMNTIAEKIYPPYAKYKLCWKGMCDQELEQYAFDYFEQNTYWFERNMGKDHIVTMSHWGSKQTWTFHQGLFRKYLQYSNMIIHETNRLNRHIRDVFSSYLVGNPCATQDKFDNETIDNNDSSTDTKNNNKNSNKLYDFSMIATMRDSKSFVDRRRICNGLNRTRANVGICGPGPQCPTLAQSKFGFHSRGDSYGSQRLMDTILSGTVPIFTRVEQYNVVPDWINWTMISDFANVSATPKEFAADIRRIARDEINYEFKHEQVLLNRDLFDWSTLIPFDTYMYRLQKKLYPDTIPSDLKSPYPALIL